MDPISYLLAKSGIPAALEAAKELLEKLFGPAAEETGLFLQDKVRTYRLRNMLKTLGKTQDMLNKAGIEPNSVPLRVLIPLLEGASLEDDEGLSEKWAALLANAATSKNLASSSPIFSNILSQLSPTDALILDKLSTKEYYYEKIPTVKEYLALRQDIIKELGLQVDEYEFSIDNLHRLGLCIPNPSDLEDKELMELFKKQDPRIIRRDMIVMTKLGRSFIEACTQPIRDA